MALKIGLDILHLEIMLMKIILFNRFEKSWMWRVFIFFYEKHHGNCNYFMILFDKWPPKLNVGGVRRLRRGNTKNYLFPSSAVCLRSQHLALLHDQLFTFCLPYFKTILKVFKSFAKGLICWLKYLKLLFHKWCKLSKLF